MTGPDFSVSRQGIEFFTDRSQKLTGGAAGKVGSSHGPDKQRVAGEDMAVRIETDGAGCVARGVNDFEGRLADIDNVVVFELPAGFWGPLAAHEPGQHPGQQPRDLFGVRLMDAKLGPGGFNNGRISGGMVGMPVGVDDMRNGVSGVPHLV